MYGWAPMPLPEEPTQDGTSQDGTTGHSAPSRAGGAPGLPAWRDELERRLQQDPSTTGERVRASLVDGVIVLRGRVSSRQAHRAMSIAASEVPGVRDVCNQLEYPRS